MKSLVIVLAVVISATGCASFGSGRILRSEVSAAAESFGDQQGRGGWYYQYHDGSEWQYMIYNQGADYWEYLGTTWARVAVDYQHPGFDGTRTARVWESTYADGTAVDVSVVVEKKEMGSDGVTFSIETDAGVTVWGPENITRLDPITVDISMTMDFGQRLYFVLDYNDHPNFDWLWFRELVVTAHLTEEPPTRGPEVATFVQPPELPEHPFGFELGERVIVPNNASVPVYRWFPDGHITWLPDEDGTNYQMYWAGASTYRTVGTSLDDMVLSPTVAVLEREPGNGIDSGGTWLMNVFRLDGPNLVGFYHAEDHYWGGEANPNFIAYKTIHVAYSDDNGVTWTKGGEIIRTAGGKPETMQWSGVGDFGVALNPQDDSYYLFYSEANMIHLARSADPLGAPGSWYMYTWVDPFTEPGLEGASDPVWGINQVPGANPSVHWNDYLGAWIMVWHAWDPPSIHIATSDDLIVWSQPQVLIASEFDTRNWYPNLIGATDQLGGQTLSLYFSYWPSKYYWTNRRFIYQELTLRRE